jgi:hypothetical protein
VQTPGPEGPAGTDGTDGTDGINAYTVTTANFQVPIVGANVSTAVASSAWMVVGQNVFVLGAGYFSVISKANSLQATLQYLDYAGNTNAGNVITSGAAVSPAGTQPDFSAITSLTDNSTGTPSNTIAIGTAIHTLSFWMSAPAIANGDLLTNYVPGYRFKILKFDARCATPVTTGAKAADLNLEIQTTNLTGGVIGLTGTYAQGAAQAGSTITANNVGSATDSFSIEAANTTTFIEGSFWLIIQIMNLDLADAISSLSAKTNSILAA